jgi:cysteine desulfurase / selenocysteine lyase
MSASRNGRGISLADLRREVVGIETLVPLLDGTERPYVYLDNAASTPVLQPVLRCVQDFLPWYSGVHRGTGFKSWVATEAYDRAHEIVGEFVGADPSTDLVTFTKNTTECTNKLAQRFGFASGDYVLTTGAEHHSNDLPWRKHASVLHCPVLPGGTISIDAYRALLQQHRGKIRLVAISGASNITGLCPPIHHLAELAHAHDALVFVDAAQLVAHRPVCMLPADFPRHIDFLAFSAHKMYAPFGTGVLIGPRDFFAASDPDMVGGGVASIVTLESVQWNDVPHNDEAGSPNVVGGVALAEACRVLQSVGMDGIAEHERRLLAYAYGRMKKIPGIRFYGPTENCDDKVGVIAFNLEGKHPALVGAILSVEGGIGVRNGYFCAQPYVKTLLQVDAETAQLSGCGVVTADVTTFPGMVRASFGCYTNEADIDALVAMTERIARNDFRGKYVQDPATGRFVEKSYVVSLKKYFPYLSTETPEEREYSESA